MTTHRRSGARRRLLRGLRRLRREERGAAVVEFALVLPVLMLLVFTFIDATRAFYTLNTLVTAAREGARFASVQDLSCPTPTTAEISRIKDRVINRAVMLGGAPLAPGYINVTLETSGGTQCENVHVTIQGYPFRPMTPIVTLLGADSIPMTREAVFRWERAP